MERKPTKEVVIKIELKEYGEHTHSMEVTGADEATEAMLSMAIGGLIDKLKRERSVREILRELLSAIRK